MKKQSDIVEEIKKQAKAAGYGVNTDNGQTNILTSTAVVTDGVISTIRKAGETLVSFTFFADVNSSGDCVPFFVHNDNTPVALEFCNYLSMATVDGAVLLDVKNKIVFKQVYKLSAWTNPNAILSDISLGGYYIGFAASAYIRALAKPLPKGTTGGNLFIEMHDEFESRAEKLYNMISVYKQKNTSAKADMINLLKDIKSHCPLIEEKVEKLRQALESLFDEKVEL